MIGRTNSGSGGLVLTKPLIHVVAQRGCTVEFSVGGVIVKSIRAEKAFSNEDGINADYYYSASATGTYTITAKFGELTKSVTETVSAVKQYDVAIPLRILYYEGNEVASLTGGWSFNDNGIGTNSLTKNAEDMVLYSATGSTSANACTFTANAIDTSSFTTIKILYDFAYTGTKGADTGNFALRTTIPTSGGWSGNYNYQANLSSGSDQTTSCSISTATNPLYACVRVWTNNGFAVTVTITIKRIWLE